MQSTEAATLDRKSGEAEGSAVFPVATQVSPVCEFLRINNSKLIELLWIARALFAGCCAAVESHRISAEHAFCSESCPRDPPFHPHAVLGANLCRSN